MDHYENMHSKLRKWKIQLHKGLPEIFVLNFLRHNPGYGYQIKQKLRSFEKIKLEISSIHAILFRLENEGSVKSSYVSSSKGPKRKLFKITPQGQKHISRLNNQWDQIVKSINFVKGLCK